MDGVDLTPLLDQLDDNIDDVQETLEPLTKAPLSETAAKLPLLDRAKLYVSITYAIESILFSFIRLNGINAKAHPVFRELTRLKQYFEKIKDAESGKTKRENLSLDKGAAGRIIRHALAGNDRYDLQRAEQLAKEKASAHIRFEQISKKRKAEDEAEREHTNPNASSSSHSSSESEPNPKVVQLPEPETEPPPGSKMETEQPVKKKRRNRPEKNIRDMLKGSGAETPSKEVQEVQSKKRKRRKKYKLEKAAELAQRNEETIIPAKSSEPPLGHSAAFQALLKGPLPKRHLKKEKRERKGREGGAGGNAIS